MVSFFFIECLILWSILEILIVCLMAPTFLSVKVLLFDSVLAIGHSDSDSPLILLSFNSVLEFSSIPLLYSAFLLSFCLPMS